MGGTKETPEGFHSRTSTSVLSIYPSFKRLINGVSFFFSIQAHREAKLGRANPIVLFAG
jgi:hypothetical protein